MPPKITTQKQIIAQTLLDCFNKIDEQIECISHASFMDAQTVAMRGGEQSMEDLLDRVFKKNNLQDLKETIILALSKSIDVSRFNSLMKDHPFIRKTYAEIARNADQNYLNIPND